MKRPTVVGGKETDLVSFRLDPEFRRLLVAEAERQGHPKPNTFARSLVQRALTNADHQELKHEIEALRSEIRKTREDIATVALALLVKAGHEDPQKAEAWIRANVRAK